MKDPNQGDSKFKRQLAGPKKIYQISHFSFYVAFPSASNALHGTKGIQSLIA
jgi:hypothetical protein